MQANGMTVNPDISDEDRLLASSKKLTLMPIHEDVEADDSPDSVIAADHANAPAIANFSLETEITESTKPGELIVASNGSMRSIVIGVSLVAIGIVGAVATVLSIH